MARKPPFKFGDIVQWDLASTREDIRESVVKFMPIFPGPLVITRVEMVEKEDFKYPARLGCKWVVSALQMANNKPVYHSGTKMYDGNNWDHRFFKLDTFLTAVRRSREKKSNGKATAKAKV